MKDYSLLGKDALIERIIELEAILYPSEAETLVRQLPLKLSPREIQVLVLLYSGSPRFVQHFTLMEELGIPTEACLKVTVFHLQQKLYPLGLTIASRYGQGYRLNSPSSLKEISLGTLHQGCADSPNPTRDTRTAHPVIVERPDL